MKEDDQLVDECKRNNAAAFEALYTKYATRMKGVAFRYSGDSSIAEDVLQEAFIKVFSSIKKYESKGRFEAWLRKVVVNTAINHFNSLKKENEKIINFSSSGKNGFDIETSEEEDIDDDYSMDELLQAVNNLPEGYKLVFNLYAIDNYSHKEIANVLKITEGTSKSQLSKARVYLKKELQNIKQLQHEQR